MEPPKAAEGIPAAEGGLMSGVTLDIDPKAVSTERSPWEGLSGEVSPWEGLTGDVPEQDEEGPWKTYLGRRGAAPPARRARVEDTDANIMVESLDRDSTMASIQVNPVVPQLVGRKSPVVQKI